MASENMKPSVQALLLADAVYRDRDTGKKVICGVFNNFVGIDFPTELLRSTVAYLQLTGIHGSAEIRVTYVDLAEDQVLIDCGPYTVNASSPLVNVEQSIELPFLPIPHPGVYAFEVHCTGEMIGRLRVSVEQAEQELEEDHP